MGQKNGGEYSVYEWLMDGSRHCAMGFVDAKTAFDAAYDLACTVGAQIGVVTRIVILNIAKHPVFEWEFGKGVISPRSSQAALATERRQSPPQ